MSRPTILRDGATALVRSIVAANIAADNATLSDANYPMTAAAGVIDCAGLDSVLLGVEHDVPGTATVIFELLFGDPDAPLDRKWSRYFLGAAPGVTPTALANEVTPTLLANSHWAELRCFGHKYVFPRITTVANGTGTTNTRVLARPGRIRGNRGFTP